MAIAEEAKFGSSAWFLSWGERLLNAGLTKVTNVLTSKTTAAAPSSDSVRSSGSFAGVLAGMTWLPYALAGVAVLILVLVFSKK